MQLTPACYMTQAFKMQSGQLGQKAVCLNVTGESDIGTRSDVVLLPVHLLHGLRAQNVENNKARFLLFPGCLEKGRKLTV